MSESSDYSDEEIIQLSDEEEEYNRSETDSGAPRTPDINVSARQQAKNAQISQRLNPDAEVSEALNQYLEYQKRKEAFEQQKHNGVDEKPFMHPRVELQSRTDAEPRPETRDGSNSPRPIDSGDGEKTPRWGSITPETEHSYRFEAVEQLVEGTSNILCKRDLITYYTEKYPEIDEQTLDYMCDVMDYAHSRQVFRNALFYLQMTEAEFVELHTRFRLLLLSRIIGRGYWCSSQYITNFINYKRFILNPIKYHFIKEGIPWTHDLDMYFWNALGQHNGMVTYNERDGLNNEIVISIFIDTCVSNGILDREADKSNIERITAVAMLQRELRPNLEE